jgi:hypothetical protein
MAVTRQQNWLGQQRVDVPHLRAIESAVANDFDVFAGILVAGRQPLVVGGFQIVTTGAVGNDAEQLLMQVAGSVAIDYEATEAGSLFRVPDTRADETLSPTNSRVSGSFTPNATNFVGLDFLRAADDSTVDNVAFMNATTDSEAFETVPLGRTIDYQIVVSATEFSVNPGIVPVAIVVTNSSNKVVSVTDARSLLCRLGTGGSNPQAIAPYAWPGGRSEAGTGSVAGGDRSIRDLKSWMDAIMTRLWELGGGEYWYSATEYRNVRMAATGATFVSTGEYFEVVSNNIHWKNLKIVFDNSTADINEVQNQTVDSTGLTDLADGECIFVDLDRTTNRTVSGLNPLVAQKAVLRTLGQSATPGQRLVLAWRKGSNFFVRDQPYAVGGSFKVATTVALGTVRISSDPVVGWDAASPVVPVIAMVADAGYTATAGGLSHNQDVAFGSASTLLPPGDIVVGRGAGAGDENVEIFTDGQFGTRVRGAAETTGPGGLAALEVESQADGGTEVLRWRNRIEQRRGVSTLDSVSRIVGFEETDGAEALALTTTLPITPEPSVDEPIAMKRFARTSKRWLEPCRYATDGALDAYTPTGAGPTKVLTADVNGVLVIDGGLHPSAGHRILVKNEVGPDNGIYTVTSAGSGGTPWVLTRAADACLNQQVINGMAVKVTLGAVNSDTCWILATPDAISVDEIEMKWLPATTADFSIRKRDVRLATAAPLPAYTVSTGSSGVGTTLTATVNGALSIDGVAVQNTDRVLIKDEGAAHKDHGIYFVTQKGTAGLPFILTRAGDADTAFRCCANMGVKVLIGVTNIGTFWRLDTSNEIVVDQTGQLFVPTDLETKHQVCVRWFDGSISVMMQSPSFEPVF